MSSVHKFPQVDHADATGELKAVYDDIQATLRVPWVAFACRVLATFPAFLPRAWKTARGHFTTRYAERGADAIRANAVLAGAPPPDPRSRLSQLGWSEEQLRELLLAIDAYNYGNPKYLLLVTAWSEAFQGRHPAGNPLSADEAAPIPYGRPPGMEPLHLVDPDTADPTVLALFERIKAMHFHHGPSSDYRTLAQWPDYLSIALDEAIAPVVRTPEYDLRARDLIVMARQWARNLPGPAGIDRSMLVDACAPHEIAGLTGLLFMYQRFIADITIDVIRLKQAFDGETAAAASPFPLA